MHSTVALSLSFLALTVSAAPAPQAQAQPSTVQVQFANDFSGANGNANIPLDGSSVGLGQAYGNTNLFKDGTLFVTSFMFTGNFANVVCDVIKNGITNVGHIANPQQDFQTFSKTPVDWETGFTINCTLPA
jgi:hypothetical protein